MIRDNALERLIAFISPGTALKRQRNAGLMQAMDKASEMQRQYMGAGYNALTQDWPVDQMSAKAATSMDIVTLRNRSRALVRDDSLAKDAVDSLARNIIGTGIRPSMNSTDATDQKSAETDFLAWCDSVESDFFGKLNFYGNQQLVVKAMAESGECLVVKRYIGRGKNMQLQLQVLEADYLVHWLTVYNDDKSYILNGIHFDSQGRVKGYEIYEQHPGDMVKTKNAYEHHFVSTDDCILMYRPDRPEQHRGVPVGHSTMLDHRMYYRYDLAEAHRKEIASLFSVFITTAEALNMGGGGQNGATTDYSGPKYQHERGERIQSGTLQYLGLGESVTFAQPPASDGYDEYATAKQRKMAKGWGLTYEEFSGDYSKVNFTSGRMGKGSMYLNLDTWQELIVIPMYCRKVWTWWEELEELKGKLTGGTLQVTWTAPRRTMTDPVKETKAIIDQLNANLISWDEAVRQSGDDPEVLLIRIKKWYDKFEEQGIVSSGDYTKEYQLMELQATKGGDVKPVPATKAAKKAEMRKLMEWIQQEMENEAA